MVPAIPLPQLGRIPPCVAVVISALLVIFPTAAHADAYKCRSPDGRTVISSEPCGAADRTESVAPAEKISAEQKAEAERQLARDRETAASLEKNRMAEEERSRGSGGDRLAEEESARRSRCLEDARREPDAVLRANLIAACQGVAPANPTVVQQPVYIPVVPTRTPRSRDEPCSGPHCPGAATPPTPTPTPSPGGGKARYGPSADKPVRQECQPVGGVIRCN